MPRSSLNRQRLTPTGGFSCTRVGRGDLTLAPPERIGTGRRETRRFVATDFAAQRSVAVTAPGDRLDSGPTARGLVVRVVRTIAADRVLWLLPLPGPHPGPEPAGRGPARLALCLCVSIFL